jgi:hypothetical protein
MKRFSELTFLICKKCGAQNMIELARQWSLKRFCHIGIGDKGYKKSVLCKNIKAISPQSWEAINQCLVHYLTSPS